MRKRRRAKTADRLRSVGTCTVCGFPRFYIKLAAAVVLFAGCAKHPPVKPDGAAALPTVDAAGLATALHRHRGRVVLVDFWATWCGPCVELLPHTIELGRRLRDCGLTVLTVSLDDADQRSAAVRILTQARATGPFRDGKSPSTSEQSAENTAPLPSGEPENYISAYGVGPAAFSAFQIGSGALPHLRLYDRDGKLVKTFDSGEKPIAPAEIDQVVERLLPTD